MAPGPRVTANLNGGSGPCLGEAVPGPLAASTDAFLWLAKGSPCRPATAQTVPGRQAVPVEFYVFLSLSFLKKKKKKKKKLRHDGGRGVCGGVVWWGDTFLSGV